jgi:pimeloyl-ACP methyl ester carboxylesterase
MTRAQGPDTAIDYRVVGSPGAERLVVAIRSGPLATVDPDPAETLTREVRVLLIGVDAAELEDPVTFSGTTPAESTIASVAELISARTGGEPVGVVGEREAAAIAIGIAATRPELVDRLALVAAARPDTALGRDLDAHILAGVTAKTLLLGATGEPGAARAATWYRGRLADARVEMVPMESSPASVDGRLALGPVWARVLSHIAPATRRR